MYPFLQAATDTVRTLVTDNGGGAVGGLGEVIGAVIALAVAVVAYIRGKSKGKDEVLSGEVAAKR